MFYLLLCLLLFFPPNGANSTSCLSGNSSCRVVDLDSIRNDFHKKTTPLLVNNNDSLAAEKINHNISANRALVDKLSEQIQVVLKHFQEPEPIGLPGQDFLPEPMYAPDTTGSLVMATGYFYNITVWGLSNFSLSAVDTRLDEMMVFVVLRIKTILIEGNYSVSNLLVSNSGPFNISLTNVTASGTVDLEIDGQGKIYANQSTIDMTYEDIEVVLADVSSILTPFVNSGGAAVFLAEKSHILANVQERMMVEINKRLDSIPKIPPLTQISPVDLAVLEGRNFVKARYEPFVISNVIDFENLFLKVKVGPVTVSGLSKFARVGNVTLSMHNATIFFDVRIITGRLFGDCKWSYDFGDSIGVRRQGQSNFTVEHVQIEARVNQSLDARKPPQLDDLQVETGPIVMKMDGNGGFDYLIEIIVKMLPRMLRYTIIDALEEPVKMAIQKDVLNKISIEQFIEQNMSEIKKYLLDKL